MRGRLLLLAAILLSVLLITGCIPSVELHTVARPDRPTGPASGGVGQELSFSTGGAYCNRGHPIEYRFDWGDGTISSWTGSNTMTKAWSAAGSYQVKAQARCLSETQVVSEWSSPLQVTIASTPPTNCIQVKVLLDDFEANEVAARLKYGTGVITVCGYVDSVKVNEFTGKPYVTLAESPSSYRLRWVFCYFPETAMSALAQLRKGSLIAVSGSLGSTFAGSVWLEDCVLR